MKNLKSLANKNTKTDVISVFIPVNYSNFACVQDNYALLNVLNISAPAKNES